LEEGLFAQRAVVGSDVCSTSNTPSKSSTATTKTTTTTNKPNSEALRLKLEEDRKERRRRLGLPEELTEEEKAAEAEKARQKAAAEAARRTQYVKPVALLERARAQLASMKRGAPGGDEQFKEAALTVVKYLGMQGGRLCPLQEEGRKGQGVCSLPLQLQPPPLLNDEQYAAGAGRRRFPRAGPGVYL
jgi:hypothetical protein